MARSFSENDLLAYAAVLESRSEHPLAREIVRAAEARRLTLPQMTDFVALPGRGVHATIEGYKVWIGGDRLYREHGEAIAPALEAVRARIEREGKSALILHREIDRRGSVGTHESSGGWLGIIGMADTMRDTVPAAIRQFKALGITRTVMLTGDNPTVARAIAERAGIDEFHASLLPEDKVRLLRDIRATDGAVMMIGDGVNDAPALANASVGVAMGAAGTDLALESAHCVLMGDDLGKVAYALSKFGMTLVAQGIAEEVRGQGVAANALWPATLLESQATIRWGLGDRSLWRKPDIVADAMVAIFSKPPDALTGQALIDEDFLRAEGVTDFARYRCDPDKEPPRVGFDFRFQAG